MPPRMVRVGDPLGGEPGARGADERGEQGEGDDDRTPDTDRRSDAHDRQERDLGDAEGQQRDGDGGAREDNGRPRRARGLGRCLLDLHALGEQVSVPRQDEQRIVDADGEADHQREERRGRGDRREVGRDQDERHRHRHPEQGGEQRYAGRDRRPERDHQDDQRHDDTQALGDAHLGGGRREQRPADRRRQTRRRGLVRQGDERLAGGIGDVVGGQVELYGDDRGRTVRRHGALDEFVERARRAADVREGGIPCGEVLDACGDSGVGDLGARWGRDDDLATGPGEFGEARGEGVHGLLGLGARDLEGVGHPALQQPRAGAEDDDEGHPEGDDEAAAPHGPMAESVER